MDIHVFSHGGGRVRVSNTLCAPAVEGGESPIRRGHPEQQGIVTVARMDCSEKKRRISSSCIREGVPNW